MVSRLINVHVSTKTFSLVHQCTTLKTEDELTCSSIPSLIPEEFIVNECAHNEKRIGYCSQMFDVNSYEFEFEFECNASVP